jgi:glutathione S-transferase
MLQVYLDPCTVNSRKVLAGLDLVGAPYELKHVDYFSGEHKKPEFLAINPNGAVPAVMDGDFALSESNAILQYAADLIGSEKHYPKDLKQRADINRWLLWEASTWFPSCYPYLVEYVVKPLLKTEQKQSSTRRRPTGTGLPASLTPGWRRPNGSSATSKRSPTLQLRRRCTCTKWQRLPLDDHPNLKRWMADVERLPCWGKTQGAVEQALQLK